MQANDVFELLKLLEQQGLDVVVDGGWGVDALVGHQTRAHADLDIAIEHKDVSKLRELLEARDYKDVPQPNSTDFNFVL